MTFNDLTKEQKLILKIRLLVKWCEENPYEVPNPLYETVEDIDQFISDKDLQKEYADEELDYMFKNENNICF